jgi:glycine cleavage system H protein
MNFPSNLHYTKDHEWVSLNDNIATVGITEFAQSELGDIVYVDITKLGETLKAHEVFGTVEAVKTVSDLFLPVAGTITEINSLLEKQPELINNDAYGNGWIIKMEIESVEQVETLLNAAAYEALVH